MRDIRKDLKERLESLDTQQSHLQFRLSELEKKKNALEALLAQEELDWRARQPTLVGFGETTKDVKLKSELSKFLMDVLRDENPHKTRELAQLVVNKGIPIKSKSPIRATHFTLVMMKNNHLVDMVDSRVWKIHKNGNSETVTVAGPDDLRPSAPPTPPV